MNEMKLRNTKLDVIGRSLVLNIAAIVINLVAVALIVIGFHESTESGAFAMKITGFVLLGATLFVLAILKGVFLFSYVARALVGGLFIVSGLVKANDPWGFAFKLEEYFEPAGLAYDYPFFESFGAYALQISILVCIAEIVLGVAIVLGGKIKLASWALILMMIFFTWLTWYTYSCNANQLLGLLAEGEAPRQCVTDCGCFGDALRGSVGRSLTPFESFWKDLVLFYFGIIIFASQWKIKLNTVKENWIMVPASMLVVIFFSWVFGWGFPIFFALIAFLGAFVAANLNIGKMGKPLKMAIYVTVIAAIFSFYTASYLPFKDYRPYAVGNDLNVQMNNGTDQVSDFFYYYENVKTKETETVPMLEWTSEYSDTNLYTYVDYKEDVILEGTANSIQDFSAFVNYKRLSDKEKQIGYIKDSIVAPLYNDYYGRKLILESDYGLDTIDLVDYDTLYYPDSLYVQKETYTGLISESNPLSIDLTDFLINADNVFLMTIRDINKVNESSIEDFKNILAGAREKGIPFFVISPATEEEADAFKELYDFDATFLGIDGVEVKIIIRSNPGLVLLKKGVVMDKWPSRSIQDFEDIYTDYIIDKQD